MEENDIWNHVVKLGALRKELTPLRDGKTLFLLNEEQQMAYVRAAENQAVLMVFNNDAKPAEVSFDVSMIKQFAVNATLTDRLGKVFDVKTENGVVKLTIPARMAGILTVKK